MLYRLCFLLPALLVFASSASACWAAVFQYGLPFTAMDGKPATALLWVPPDADRLRGVLVGNVVVIEEHFSQNPAIRKVCAEEKLAIVLLTPSLDVTFDVSKGAGDKLQTILNDLAKLSGHPELAVAPIMPYGHSVGSIFTGKAALWAGDRCFGAIAFKGGTGLPAAADAGAGIPFLIIKGQYEEFGPGPSGNLRENENRETSWRGMRGGVASRRAATDQQLMALLVEPGASHFAWGDTLVPYTAGFIRQCARQRIPGDWPVDAKEPIRCRAIDPKTGALSTLELERAAEIAPAAVADFKGDPKRAMWHFDLELARLANDLHLGIANRQTQYVTFADPKSGKAISVGHDLRLRLSPTWIGPDTFKVAATFLDQAPDKYPKIPGPVGHAAGPIQFRTYAGAFEQIGPDTFRVAMDGRAGLRGEILAFHPGDKTYRWAEQQARLNIPKELRSGKPQTITFAPPTMVERKQFPIDLKATSSADLPVRFYVESGPAEVKGNQLALAEIPRKAAAFKVVIVAYQYGSAIEPLVQTAEPVRVEIVVTP